MLYFMNKETRNHYLGLLLTFIFAMALGYLYLELTKNDESPGKTKKPEVEKGGACKYVYDTFPAIIFSVDTIRNEEFDLRILDCSYEDDLLYCDSNTFHQLNNSYVKKNELDKYGISPGDTICYIQMNITKGSCNPHVNYYSLEKFPSNQSPHENPN